MKAASPREWLETLLPKLALWMPVARERKECVKSLLKDMVKAGAIQNVGGPTRAAIWALKAAGSVPIEPQRTPKKSQ